MLVTPHPGIFRRPGVRVSVPPASSLQDENPWVAFLGKPAGGDRASKSAADDNDVEVHKTAPRRGCALSMHGCCFQVFENQRINIRRCVLAEDAVNVPISGNNGTRVET